MIRIDLSGYLNPEANLIRSHTFARIGKRPPLRRAEAQPQPPHQAFPQAFHSSLLTHPHLLSRSVRYVISDAVAGADYVAALTSVY